MRDFSQDHNWLSINTATVRKSGGQVWPLDLIIEECARRGIRAISPWRDQVAAVGLERVVKQLRDTGIQLSGYCRGGFYPAVDAAGRQAALDDTRRAIDEAKTLNAPCLVLVVGGLPGTLTGKAAYRDISRARAEVRDGIAASLEYAREVGMPLAIEPLHPMQAAERACVNTLEQALDLCDELDPVLAVESEPSLAPALTLTLSHGERGRVSGTSLGGTPDTAPKGTTGTALGVALDTYHVWWDPKLQKQIARAGGNPARRRLLAYHVSDWLTPTRDLLNDRGMMGDGIVELKKIRGWVEQAGYVGFSEVEIFSDLDWWQRPGDEVLDTCIARHMAVV